MVRRRPIALAAVILGVALAAPASALAVCPGADTLPTAANLAAVGQTTLCLINEQRSARGLSALSEERRLTAASTAFSMRLVGEQFFDHVAPDGSTLVGRLTAAGYISASVDWSAGENIAWGQSELSTPGSIVAAWMQSPGHRANILTGDYTQIGLGVVTGSPVDAVWGATYATDFGSIGDGSSADHRSDQGSGTTTAIAAANTAAANKAAARRARSACVRARAASKHRLKRGKRAETRACRPARAAPPGVRSTRRALS